MTILIIGSVVTAVLWVLLIIDWVNVHFRGGYTVEKSRAISIQGILLVIVSAAIIWSIGNM